MPGDQTKRQSLHTSMVKQQVRVHSCSSPIQERNAGAIFTGPFWSPSNACRQGNQCAQLTRRTLYWVQYPLHLVVISICNECTDFFLQTHKFGAEILCRQIDLCVSRSFCHRLLLSMPNVEKILSVPGECLRSLNANGISEPVAISGLESAVFAAVGVHCKPAALLFSVGAPPR